MYIHAENEQKYIQNHQKTRYICSQSYVKSNDVQHSPRLNPHSNPNNLAVTRVLSTIHPNKPKKGEKKLGRLYLMKIGDA